MSKKFKFISTLAVIGSLTIAYQNQAVEKIKGKSQISAQFEQLLLEHQKFVQAAYSTNHSDGKPVHAALTNANFGFERDFFQYTSFVQDAHIQNFLKSVEYDINRGNQPGFTMMSYTSMSLVNGKSHTIQYTYQSDGKDITLVKQSNNNGQLLKSVYSFDVNSKSMKANDFRENNVVHQKVYKI